VPLSRYFAWAGADENPGSFQYNVWTNDNGLPVNTVMAISQTPDGYLWLGNGSGDCTFDGVRFDVFSHEKIPFSFQ